MARCAALQRSSFAFATAATALRLLLAVGCGRLCGLARGAAYCMCRTCQWWRGSDGYVGPACAAAGRIPTALPMAAPLQLMRLLLLLLLWRSVLLRTGLWQRRERREPPGRGRLPAALAPAALAVHARLWQLHGAGLYRTMAISARGCSQAQALAR